MTLTLACGSGLMVRLRAALIIVALGLLALPAGASAHAFLERSEPEANAVIPEPPAEVLMWFTEPLEPRYSRAELYDAQGNPVPTEASRIGADPNLLVLPLPADLARGTYTVQWRNVSAADGHPEVGYFPITVGSQSDVVIPSPPKLDEGSGTVSLATAGRWLSLLGVVAAVGSLITWLFVVRPSLATLDRQRQETIAQRTRVLAAGGAASALLGSLLLLIAQTRTAAGTLTLSALGDVLLDTRFGQIWLPRAVLLIALGVVLWRRPTFAPEQSRLPWFGLALALAALLPFSLNSHAAAQPDGRPTAVATDWLHLLGAAVWVGGLASLLVGLVLTRRIPAEQRRKVYAAAIPRFSTLAISSAIVLALSGFYAAWLQVGSVTALRETDYGRALALKLLLVLPLLLLGTFNLLVTGPGMLKRARARLHFSRSVLAEVLLGVAILLVVGVLTGLPPAREQIASGSDHLIYRLSQDNVGATLHLTPGSVGLNRYTADLSVPGGSPPDGTEVLLRFSRDDQIEGVREVELTNQGLAPGRYEAQGRELSVVGQWQIELIVRRPDSPEWRARTLGQISQFSQTGEQPTAPPRFAGLTPVLLVVLAAVAITLIVYALRRRGDAGNRRFMLEAGVLLALVCAIVLPLTRAEADTVDGDANPIPLTQASVDQGRPYFLENCASCHGQDARGNGPLASGQVPPPADLYAEHVDDHPDRQIYQWIRDGIPNSAMSGVGDSLSDEQIWHLVNYIRSLRHPDQIATP